MPYYQDDPYANTPGEGIYPSDTTQPALTGPTTAQLDAVYKKYLNRGYDPNQDPNKIWANNPNFERDIAGSEEAKQWAAKRVTAGPVATAPMPTGSPSLQYGAGPAYNAPGGLQQQFWQTLGVTGGTGTITPGLLASKAGELSKLGISVVSEDKIRLPDGTIVDVAGNFNPQTGGLAVWQDPRYSATGGAPGSGGGAAPSGSGGGGGGGTTEATSGGLGNAQRDALFRALLARSQQSLGVNAQNDFNIRQQADPYAAALERSRRNYLADTAEKAGPYANLQGEARVTAAKAGESAGLFESTLVSKEIQARRDEIQNALTSMAGLLSQDQTVALQRELATMNDALQRSKMQQENDQYLSTLGFNAADRAAYWDAINRGAIS